MDLYMVTMCYNARQENAIIHITQKNIQGMYAKLQKNPELNLWPIMKQERIEPKEVKQYYKPLGILNSQ